MPRIIITVCVSLVVIPGLAAQQSHQAKATGDTLAKIREAMSAAPADIAKNATIVEMDKNGHMTQLRAGSNGWTCMPSTSGAAGAAGAEPMCLDKTWTDWADAWVHKKQPHTTAMGIAYMLRGDRGASNTDPYATAPTADNQWVVSPAHIMVLVPDAKMLDALPTDPHSGGAWVMWKGTPYVHIMVPVKAVSQK
jgi:hypothetical protein